MQKVTIYTLAEELGVTPSSVSRAFNPNSKLSDSKRNKILNIAKEYDFTPNRMASRLSKVKKLVYCCIVHIHHLLRRWRME